MSIIDIDPDMIKAAQSFGFKIYYGDGTRLDSLHHSGADEAEVILIRVDDCEAANRIAALCLHEFPQSKVLVRSFDRRQRDFVRLTEQIQGGLAAGRNHMYRPEPEPLSPVRKPAANTATNTATDTAA